MQVRSRRDLIAGLVVAAAGIAYFAETFRIQTTTDAVGPETFPMIVGAAMAVLGLAIAAGSMRSRPPVELEAALDTVGTTGEADAGDADEDPPVDVRRLLVCFGLFAVYALVLIPVGFLLSSAVFLFVMTSLYRPEKWLRNAIYSVVFTTILYFGFKDGLGVFLPPGILG